RLSEFGNALVEYARQNPIAYTGLYREDAPPKPAANEAPAEKAAPAETKVVETPEGLAEVSFGEEAGDRLKSRVSVTDPGDLEPNAAAEPAAAPSQETAPKAETAPEPKPAPPPPP